MDESVLCPIVWIPDLTEAKGDYNLIHMMIRLDWQVAISGGKKKEEDIVNHHSVDILASMAFMY